MPPVNPNTLSDAEYWARVNGQAAPASPQGIAAIAGGSPNWGGVPSGWLAQMAADIASRGGMAVQQNGYDATAAVPVAAGPAWAGPSPVPAYPQSGANMTMPGSREAWQQWGIPPVVMQSSPYATAAYRTYTDPYGQIGVQPLIGFPSAYPHVLSGVPNSPFRVQGFINALLPQAGFMPFMGMPQMSMPQQPRAQGVGGGGGTTTAKKNITQPAAPAQQIPFVGPPPPHVRYDADAVPYASWNKQPAPTAGPRTHPVGMYPGGTPPEPSSFTPDLLSPEEAAELADGMYVDPNKTVMQNLLDAMSAVSIPLSLGAGPLLYSAPRIVGGAVVPEAAGALPSAMRALP